MTRSPCNLDHLGFKGLHMLQKGLHGLSCVNDGLRDGKSKGKGEERMKGWRCWEPSKIHRFLSKDLFLCWYFLLLSVVFKL